MPKLNGIFSRLALLLILAGCKQDSPKPIDPVKEEPTILDSVNMLFKDVYLWNNLIDQSLDANAFENRANSENSLRSYIDAMAYTAINPATQLPYEFDAENLGRARYSTFISRNSVSATTADFGFTITTVPSLNEYRILYVKKGSRVSDMGVKRSDRVMCINDKNVSELTAENTAYIRNALQQEKIKLCIANTTDETYTVEVEKTRYGTGTILKDTILAIGDKRIGYLALLSFPMLNHNIRSQIDQVFKRFSSDNITYLVVDLRYNTGGYVSTSRHIANLIIPARFDGEKMYHLAYNGIMRNRQQKYLKDFKVLDFLGMPEYKDDGSFLSYADYDYSEMANTFYFDKKGTLDNIESIYYVVSGQTASAAELLINNISPHVPSKLIGRKTYGKPVGYFAIDLGDYSIYLSSFLAYNSVDRGEYYSGFPVDMDEVDDVTTDFGSLNDPAIVRVIEDLFPQKKSKEARMSISRSQTRQNKHEVFGPIGNKHFVGMIEDLKRN